MKPEQRGEINQESTKPELKDAKKKSLCYSKYSFKQVLSSNSTLCSLHLSNKTISQEN
jgi:hypothetical protein